PSQRERLGEGTWELGPPRWSRRRLGCPHLTSPTAVGEEQSRMSTFMTSQPLASGRARIYRPLQFGIYCLSVWDRPGTISGGNGMRLVPSSRPESVIRRIVTLGFAIIVMFVGVLGPSLLPGASPSVDAQTVPGSSGSAPGGPRPPSSPPVAPVKQAPAASGER